MDTSVEERAAQMASLIFSMALGMSGIILIFIPSQFCPQGFVFGESSRTVGIPKEAMESLIPTSEFTALEEEASTHKEHMDGRT